jgi:hypothetical protein
MLRVRELPAFQAHNRGSESRPLSISGLVTPEYEHVPARSTTYVLACAGQSNAGQEDFSDEYIKGQVRHSKSMDRTIFCLSMCLIAMCHIIRQPEHFLGRAIGPSTRASPTIPAVSLLGVLVLASASQPLVSIARTCGSSLQVRKQSVW